MGGGGKEKFVLSSVLVPLKKTQTRQRKDSLEMCEQHLDFLSPATGLHVLRCGARTGHVAGVFVQIPRILRARAFGQPCGLSLQVTQSNLLAPSAGTPLLGMA